MRPLSWLVALGASVTIAGCKTPEMARRDMLREARIGCEKGDAPSCFHAGVLYSDDGDAEKAETFHSKACALKHVGSCDALAELKEPNRERALATACRSGDLPSCARLADEYTKSPAGLARAKKLDEQVCQRASLIGPTTSARDLHGTAAACARIARSYTDGTGVKPDGVLAMRFETLATLLFTEALFRLEKQQDAQVEREIASLPPTPREKHRAQRETEAARQWHTTLLSTPELEAGRTPRSPRKLTTPLTAIEQAFSGPTTLSVAPAGGGAVNDDATHCRETGDAVSCTIAASLLEKSDPKAALELHAAGCTKRLDECWSLVAYAESALRRRDAARATQILERGCELTAPNACLRLATELELGERGIAQDVAKAARLLERACERGSARACWSLATYADDGRGIGKNPARAKQLRTKAESLDRPAPRRASDPVKDEEACRKSHVPEKCEAAGDALQDTDAVRAEELHRIGCSADKASCTLWRFALDRFRRDDASRGLRLLEQGCQDASASACLVLAELHHLGYRSVQRTETRAAELYQRACDLGDPLGCRVTASRFRAAKNVEKADELRDRALKYDEEAGERWAHDLAEQRLRDPQQAELDRAREEWRALAERARMRAQARTQRLESAYLGRRAPAPPPFVKEDADASMAREAFIRRTSSFLFPAAPKK